MSNNFCNHDALNWIFTFRFSIFRRWIFTGVLFCLSLIVLQVVISRSNLDSKLLVDTTVSARSEMQHKQVDLNRREFWSKVLAGTDLAINNKGTVTFVIKYSTNSYPVSQTLWLLTRSDAYRPQMNTTLVIRPYYI